MKSENRKSAAGEPSRSKTLLADLFRASAELRFHIKSLRLTRVEQNPSWAKHTEIMRSVEIALNNGDGHASDCAVHNMPAYPNGPCDCMMANAALRRGEPVASNGVVGERIMP